MANDQPAQRHIELTGAIEHLYTVFSPYSLPDFTNRCAYCYTEADEALIRSKPLRELREPELISYAFGALLDWGDSCVFRHFLPRIYELMTVPFGPDYFAIDPEILVSKLRHGKWREWPLNEQAAIERFLHCLWRKRLSESPPKEEYDELCEGTLCAIAQAEDVLAPYLSDWEADSSEPALHTLGAFILRSGIAVPGGTARNAFWNGREVQYEELKRWVVSPRVKIKLMNALSGADDELSSGLQAALMMISEDTSSRDGK